MKLVYSATLILSASAVWPVPESDFYPIIEYWRAGDFRPNQLCGTTATAAQASTYPARASAGLMRWSEQLLTLYRSQAERLSTKDLTYNANQRRKSSDWDTLQTSAMKGVVAQARTGGRASFSDLLCEGITTVPANNFCYAMGNFSQATQCLTDYTYVDPTAVAATLIQGQDFGWSLPEGCPTAESAGRDFRKLDIQQFAYTPDEMNSGVISSESRVYYLLLKAIDHLQRFAESEYLVAVNQASGNTLSLPVKIENANVGIHELFVNDRGFKTILPEWEVERLLMINEPRFMNGPTLRTPFGAIASRGNDLLVVFRRPISTYDSRLALYNQQSFKYLYNFTGEVHDGASTIFQTLSGVLEFALDAFYESKDLSNLLDPVRVTFAAADLPASGGAVILASHIQKILSEKLGGAKNVEVNAVVFGTPYVSDSAFVDKLRKTIEVRSIAIEPDSTDLFPCPYTLSCDERVLLPRTGIETGKQYTYASLPGRVTIPLSSLARYGDMWTQESTVLQMAAIKDCAYHCYFTKLACSSDPDHRCDTSSCPSFV